MSMANLAIDMVIDYLKKHTKEVAIGAGAAAAGAAVGAIAVKEHDQKVIAKEKEKSFEHGLRKGVTMAYDTQIEASSDLICAWAAMAYYVARVDGKISLKEKKLLNEKLDVILKDDLTDKNTKNEIRGIVKKKELVFEDVVVYLEKLPINIVETYVQDLYSIAMASSGISEEEKIAINNIENYIKIRLDQDSILEKKKTYNDNFSLYTQEAYFDYLIEKKISQEVSNYSMKMKLLDMSFSMKTKLTKSEIALLFTAVALQVSRIYIVNYFTSIEKAGEKNKKESFLHKQQEKLFSGLKKEGKESPQRYFAPLKQIITTVGVPYDTTLKKKELDVEIFKGANHRFATLGHDPVIGLLVGTVNIATNTITTVPNEKHFPTTYHVRYDSNMKNPTITENALFTEAMLKLEERSKDDIKPLIAAFVKQLIHIATDLYTPAGIFLPGANLILSNKTVESLTKFVSTGDAIKISASATFAEIINKLIGILYGCFLLEENPDALEESISNVKVKKIIIYSNAIATSSSIINAYITKNPKDLDWGGLLMLMGRLFDDLNFIYDVKNEFISNGLGEIDSKIC